MSVNHRRAFKFVAVWLTTGLLTAVIAVPAAVAGPVRAQGSETSARDRATYAVVTRWSDGDTVVTDLGTVRLIGVDTPERGVCGSVASTRLAERIAPVGTTVRLANPTSVQDTDKYGRLLRYVIRNGVDVGARQVKAGAPARYDSRTGYDWHPRQARYIKLDRRHDRRGCEVPVSGSGGSGSTVPSGTSCPQSAPIKGNRGSSEWIYHLPWQQYYGVTNPEECFATEAAAQRAGYRRAKV